MTRKRAEYAAHSKRVTRTARWKALLLQVLRRDEWKCVRCGEMRRLEIDHVLPVKTHPELSFSIGNLQTLCGPCHSRKTRTEVGHKPLPPERQKWRDFIKEQSMEGNHHAR